MEAKAYEGKRSSKDKNSMNGDHEDSFDDDNMEEEDNCTGSGDDEKKKGFVLGGGVYGKRGGTSGGASGGVLHPSCQVEKCGADLIDAKRYHKRHKVCEVHAKAAAVSVAGLRQRFCQQCSRFHELTEFDEAKRSCRRRLAGHNERRRKSSGADSCGEASSRKGVGTSSTNQTKDSQFRQTDDRGSSRFQATFPGNLTCKKSQFR